MISEDDYDIAYAINDNWDYLRYPKREYVDVEDFYRFVIVCIRLAKCAEIETEDDE